MVSDRPTRLSVNISTVTDEAVREVSQGKDVSVTEAVRRLIGYGIIIYRAVGEGKDVLIRDAVGTTERIVLVD